MQYFSINKEIILGNQIISKGVSLEICSSAIYSSDWCTLDITAELLSMLSLESLSPSKVFLGYDGSYDEVFSGFLSSVKTNPIILKDDTIFLENTVISKSFVDATFQEAVTYCLTKSEITNFTLPSKSMPKKSFTITKKSAIAAIKEIKRLWNVSEKHYFEKHHFYLGNESTQTKTYKFTYGVNIISLEQTSGKSWKMTIPALPYLRHSTEFILEHPKISGTFKIQKVTHQVDDAGFTRTIIEFEV